MPLRTNFGNLRSYSYSTIRLIFLSCDCQPRYDSAYDTFA